MRLRKYPLLWSFLRPQVSLTTSNLNWDFLKSRDFHYSLLVAQGLAIFWWFVCQLLSGPVTIWGDQTNVFMPVGRNVSDPYSIYWFSNVPWTSLPLALFAYLPLNLAVLFQLCAFFAIITTIIYRFGGNHHVVLVALTSFWALDSAIELNVEWLTCIGLLVPPALSGPFLIIKPQLLSGYWFSFTVRQILLGTLVIFVVLIMSLLAWGFWIPDMLRTYSILTGRSYNLAPSAILPLPISLLIGIACAWQAWSIKSAFWGILAWMFFTPYITFYSLHIHFALFSVVFTRSGMLISLLLWIIYGGVLVLYFLG